MPLQRETVARAALDVVDEVGLDGLTMRRLAAELEIKNQSLYWHFTNKQELLNCMAELMFAEIFAELQNPEQSQEWPEWLAAFARLFRQAMLAHRDGARHGGSGLVSHQICRKPGHCSGCASACWF
jgi:TetR/AcrR family tetracycline transcriptional repressor